MLSNSQLTLLSLILSHFHAGLQYSVIRTSIECAKYYHQPISDQIVRFSSNKLIIKSIIQPINHSSAFSIVSSNIYPSNLPNLTSALTPVPTFPYSEFFVCLWPPHIDVVRLSSIDSLHPRVVGIIP